MGNCFAPNQHNQQYNNRNQDPRNKYQYDSDETDSKKKKRSDPRRIEIVIKQDNSNQQQIQLQSVKSLNQGQENQKFEFPIDGYQPQNYESNTRTPYNKPRTPKNNPSTTKCKYEYCFFQFCKYQHGIGQQIQTEGKFNEKRVLTLFHVTNADSAFKILNSRYMLPGSRGYAGAGIYFGDDIQACKRKAQKHGAYLVCKVDVGKSLIIRAPQNFDQAELKKRCCDSVKIEGLVSGIEYVIYDSSKIQQIYSQGWMPLHLFHMKMFRKQLVSGYLQVKPGIYKEFELKPNVQTNFSVNDLNI